MLSEEAKAVIESKH